MGNGRRRVLHAECPAWPKAWPVKSCAVCLRPKIGGSEGLTLAGTESLGGLPTITLGFIPPFSSQVPDALDLFILGAHPSSMAPLSRC